MIKYKLVRYVHFFSIVFSKQDSGLFKKSVLIRSALSLAILVVAMLKPITANAKGLFLDATTYEKLSQQKRTEYVQGIRKAIYEFEQKQTHRKFALKANEFFFQTLFAPATAADDKKCSIGGVSVKVVSDRCLTRGQACGEVEGTKDTFKCGSAFGNGCIKREPIEDISKRCYEDSQQKPAPKPDEYKKLAPEEEKKYAELCGSGLNEDGCTWFKKRVDEIKTAATGAKPPPAAAPTGDAKPPDAVPAKPPGDQPARPGAGASAAAATPPVQADECSQLMNFVLEGTGAKGAEGKTVKEKMFHSESKQNIGAVASAFNSENFWYEPSNVPSAANDCSGATPTTTVQQNAPRVIEAIKTQLAKGSECTPELASSTWKFMLGTDTVKSDVTQAAVYRNQYTGYSTQLAPKAFGAKCASDTSKAYFNRFNSGSTKAADAFKSFLTRIADLKKQCGDKANLTAQLSVFAHGHNDASGNECRFQLSPTNSVSAKEFYDQFYKPLLKSGVQTAFNLEPCYGGCLLTEVEKLAAADPELKGASTGNSCILSTASSDRPGYGQDELFDGTRSGYYSFFLGKMRNPLKANLCATALDKWNLGQMSGVVAKSATRSLTPTTNPLLRTDVKDAFTAIGTTLGDASYASLGSDCDKALKANPSEDPSLLSKTKLTDEQRDSVLKCVLEKQDSLEPKLSQVRGVTELLKDATNSELSPGVKSVIEYAKLDKSKLQGCSQDWSKYKREPAATQSKGPVQRSKPVDGAASAVRK